MLIIVIINKNHFKLASPNNNRNEVGSLGFEHVRTLDAHDAAIRVFKDVRPSDFNVNLVRNIVLHWQPPHQDWMIGI